MRRQNVELERFDMGERLGGLEARNVGNGGVRSHIQEHLRADQRARSAVIEAHFDCLRRDETPVAHDQFGAACLVVAQMRVNERLHHVALALTNLRHVDLDRARHRPELAPRCAPHARPRRCEFRSCWAGTRHWGRSRRSICARQPRSAVRARAMCQAVSLPPPPLPRMRTSTCSG